MLCLSQGHPAASLAQQTDSPGRPPCPSCGVTRYRHRSVEAVNFGGRLTARFTAGRSPLPFRFRIAPGRGYWGPVRGQLNCPRTSRPGCANRPDKCGYHPKPVRSVAGLHLPSCGRPGYRCSRSHGWPTKLGGPTARLCPDGGVPPANENDWATSPVDGHGPGASARSST